MSYSFFKNWETEFKQFAEELQRYAKELDEIEHNAKRAADVMYRDKSEENKNCLTKKNDCKVQNHGKNNSNFVTEYTYTNKSIDNEKEELEEMKATLNHWTFTFRCNKNSKLNGVFVFKNRKYVFEWDNNIEQVVGVIYRKVDNGTFEQDSTCYIWDELNGKLVELAYNKYNKQLKQDYEKPEMKELKTNSKKTVIDCSKSKKPVSYTVKDNTVKKTEKKQNVMEIDPESENQSVTANMKSATNNKFTTNITAETLLNKLNSKVKAEQEEYDIEKYKEPILKAVDAILEFDLYETLGSHEVFFNTQQIVNMMQDQGVIFNYDRLEDLYSDNEISTMICDAFKFPMVTVTNGIVYCDLI